MDEWKNWTDAQKRAWAFAKVAELAAPGSAFDELITSAKKLIDFIEPPGEAQAAQVPGDPNVYPVPVAAE